MTIKFLNDSHEALVIDEMNANGMTSIVEFINRRKKLVSKVVDFRKSQIAKRNWKLNRRSMMKGIMQFNKSSKGKRFHRQLGRFLALRAPNYKSIVSTRLSSLRLSHEESLGRFDELVMLNSIRTHMFIEGNYTLPTDEQLAFELYHQVADESLGRIIEVVKNGEDIDEDDFEFLCDIYDPELFKEID